MFVTEPDVPLERCWLMASIGTEQALLESWRKNEGTGRAEYGLIIGVGSESSTTYPPIDGAHIRNVIFQNVTITYRGGPLILENVGFVKCKFDVSPNAAGVALARTVMKQIAVTFPSTNI
jgi:hypothetical protein